jgi:hypothetical protein
MLIIFGEEYKEYNSQLKGFLQSPDKARIFSGNKEDQRRE